MNPDPPRHDVNVSEHLNRARVKGDVLWAYLTTHEKLSAAALRRVQRMLDSCEGSTAAVLRHFRSDVEAELVWLRTVQLPTETVWEANTLTTDTIRTLMLTRRQLARPELSPVHDVETLTCSVTAKLLLWRTLSDLADLLAVDREHLVVLHQNAHRQLKDLDSVHEALWPMGGVA